MFCDAPLAQVVEQRTVNPCVAGSNPAGGGGSLLAIRGFFYFKAISGSGAGSVPTGEKTLATGDSEMPDYSRVWK